MKFFINLCLILLILLGGNTGAIADTLADRVAQFPDWNAQPPAQPASGDLIYPVWMAGTWNVTSTLVDLVAPLAPQIVTPGFENNRQYLQVPVKFPVRFVEEKTLRNVKNSHNFSQILGFPLKGFTQSQPAQIVADRAFNGLSIGEAYLGNQAISEVKVDPNSPNRQITLFRNNRQLISTVTKRLSEQPASDQFIATEIIQQQFRGSEWQDEKIVLRPYFNEVETTTAYQILSDSQIAADQITAIYLSPQDPNYFAAKGQPVALYRYHLELSRNSD
jgi:hypothetical protein